MPADTPRSFQEIILRLQAYWAGQGCAILQPYDMEVGAGTFHPATTLRALGPAALGRRLRPALAPPDRRPLRRQPEPLAALLPVPGDHQTLAARPAGHLPRLARRHRHRHGPARHPLRRGRLGEPDARRLGPRLGGLVRRHGGVASSPTSSRSAATTAARSRASSPTASSASPCTCSATTTSRTCRSTTPPPRSRSPTATSSARPRPNTPAGTSTSPTPRCCSATSRTPRPNAPASSPSPRWTRGPAAASSWRCPPTTSASRPRHLFNLLDARGVISVTERQAYIGRVRTLAKACADAFVAAGCMSGRRLMTAFLAFTALFAAALVWFQVLRLLPARRPRPRPSPALPVTGYDGIDAASSPLKLRGCFRLDPAAAAALPPRARRHAAERALLVPLLRRRPR